MNNSLIERIGQYLNEEIGGYLRTRINGVSQCVKLEYIKDERKVRAGDRITLVWTAPGVINNSNLCPYIMLWPQTYKNRDTMLYSI